MRLPIAILAVFSFALRSLAFEQSSFDRAFYDWWEIAKHGGGPMANDYVNLECFSGLHSLGVGASDLLKQRMTEDRFPDVFVTEAIWVLTGSTAWHPAPNPRVPNNLLVTQGSAEPSEKASKDFPNWAVLAGEIAPALHPRKSRFRSMKICLSSSMKVVELACLVQVPEKDYFVLQLSYTGNQKRDNFQVIIRVKWYNQERVMLETNTITHEPLPDTTEYFDQRWYSWAYDYKRPCDAAYAIVALT